MDTVDTLGITTIEYIEKYFNVTLNECRGI